MLAEYVQTYLGYRKELLHTQMDLQRSISITVWYYLAKFMLETTNRKKVSEPFKYNTLDAWNWWYQYIIQYAHANTIAIGIMASLIVIVIRLHRSLAFIILTIRCVLAKKAERVTEEPIPISHIVALQVIVIPPMLVLVKSNSWGIILNAIIIVPPEIK